MICHVAEFGVYRGLPLWDDSVMAVGGMFANWLASVEGRTIF